MQKKSFTLIELLVVIAIIGVLAGMLLPALSSARARARATTCMNNLKSISLAYNLYEDDNKDWFPQFGYMDMWLCGDNSLPLGRLYACDNPIVGYVIKLPDHGENAPTLDTYTPMLKVFACPDALSAIQKGNYMLDENCSRLNYQGSTYLGQLACIKGTGRVTRVSGVAVPTDAMLHNEWLTDGTNVGSHDRDFKKPLSNLSFVDGHVDKGRYENEKFTGDDSGIRFGTWGFQAGCDKRFATAQAFAWLGK